MLRSRINKMYFGGVEGGATHSNLVICDETGTVVGTATGPGTNHWTLGIEECAIRIIEMVHAAKQDAGIPRHKPLNSLGLTLSGCEQESSNAELAACVREKDSDAADAIYVASDTAGSLYTGAPDGGMVLIAGTGSNSYLKTSSGVERGCGGWGYLLGDEGGAYWIAHKAVKTVFDQQDGMKISDFPVEKVWEVVKEHFEAETRADLLPHAYKHFDKSKFAGLTVKLAALATQGDRLARHLFSCAGAELAAHVAPLTFCADEHRLRVVCVGSVWKSWELLKIGFLRKLRARDVITELEMVTLRVSSALGAAWLAAKHVNYDLPRDDDAFCSVFYTYYPYEHLDLENDTDVHGPPMGGEPRGFHHPRYISDIEGPDGRGMNGRGLIIRDAHLYRNHVNARVNGHANGHANGHVNGHANGHVNGRVNGNILNGIDMENMRIEDFPVIYEGDR